MTDTDQDSAKNVPAETPAVERAVAFDMVRRGAPVLPLVVIVAGLVWGVHGALSAAFSVAIVVVNLVAAAFMLGWAARISPAMLMGTALFGFLARMVLVALAVLAVKGQGWVDFTALAVTLLVTHIGLLVWETRHVSASLAFPGLAPKREA